MTKASEDIIKIAYKIDSMKQFSGTIRESQIQRAFDDESFSLFPLYMAFSKKVDFDVLEYEPEAIREIVGNKFNSDRINTVISTLANGDAWINPVAFDMFVDASTGREIDPNVLSPDYADEIVWGLINLAGIDGSIALPIKTDVLKFIKACLDNDGWEIPPIQLFFKNITDFYEEEDVSDIEKKFGNMSMTDIHNFSDNRKLEKLPPHIINYFIRLQEVSSYTIEHYNKMMVDWTTLINGD